MTKNKAISTVRNRNLWNALFSFGYWQMKTKNYRWHDNDRPENEGPFRNALTELRVDK